MTQKEKFNLLTVDDIRKIDDVIGRVSGGHSWAKCSSDFWMDVLKKLQNDTHEKEKEQSGY